MEKNSSQSNSLIKNIWWITSLNFKYLPLITIFRIIGLTIQQASGLIQSFILALIVDGAIELVNKQSVTTDDYIPLILIFLAFYSLRLFGSILVNYGQNMNGLKLRDQLPFEILYKKLNAIGIANLENPEIQNVVNRYKENTYTFALITDSILGILSLGIVAIAAFITSFSLLPLPTLAILLLSIPSFFTDRYFIKRLWDEQKLFTIESRRSRRLVHKISDPALLKEIKLTGAFEYLKNFFSTYIDRFFRIRQKTYNLWSVADLVNGILMIVAQVYGLFLVIQAAVEGNISTGEIVFYSAALTTFSGYISSIAVRVQQVSESNIKLTEASWLLNLPNEDDKNKLPISASIQPPQINLNNISFKYPGSEKYILNGFNLEIKPGERIAIVGENGAGKTTLIKLITRLYRVNSGEILINNENINDLKLEDWHKNIGVLFQDFNTYDDLTVFENIALGRMPEGYVYDEDFKKDGDIRYEEIVEAAKKADAYDFIMDYPNKFGQVLSEKYEGGIRPSTGQWQRIAIARFFYRNAPLLILDEPTASIDAVAEANIFNRIYEFIQNKTVIIVSHRFSTVRNADRIIVFDKGKIVEEGSHEELMNMNGKYAEAFKLQAEGYS